MAEIKIEKKKPIWPWILLILVLAAVLYYFMNQDTDDDDGEIETIETTDGTSFIQPENQTTTYYV